MKYIRNISDEQNKVGDTDNVFRLNLFEDNQLFNFGENNLTVNIANSSGYILSLTPKKETGNTVIDLDFNDAPLKSLTPDDYLLEVEVKFSDGTTATFPTKGGMPFTVNGNLKETSGTLVPNVTFDNVLDAVDKKIAVYMDTVKIGPQGPIGPAGNVDTSHDNTFTGNNIFTKPIDGALKTKAATFTDFATVASNMITYAGIWYVGSNPVANYVNSTAVWYLVEVITGNNTNTGIIRTMPFGSQVIYYAGVSNGVLGGWKKLSDDATVTHNTGTETVAGDKTFTGNSIFTQLINGYTKTKISPSTDLNSISGSGKYALTTASTYTNAPSGMPNNAILIVENDKETGSFGDVIYQRVLSRDTVNKDTDMTMFFRMRFGNVWSVWKQVAKDGNVIHNTGNETINGDKTFLSGNYGLRVTSTGIQKTSDSGTTWVNI